MDNVQCGRVSIVLAIDRGLKSAAMENRKSNVTSIIHYFGVVSFIGVNLVVMVVREKACLPNVNLFYAICNKLFFFAEFDQVLHLCSSGGQG